MPQDDEFLIDQARAGSNEALTELIRRHHLTFQQDLLKKLPQRWQAVLSPDDVLQQTYTDVFLAIARFVPTGRGSFVSWVNRLAHNNVIDAIRSLEAEKRGGVAQRLTTPGDQQSMVFLEQLMGSVSSRSSPTRLAVRNELAHLLQVALAQLPDLYRRVVQRYDLLGHSMHDIAADLTRSSGAVHLIRVRAHRRLRVLLSGQTSFFHGSA